MIDLPRALWAASVDAVPATPAISAAAVRTRIRRARAARAAARSAAAVTAVAAIALAGYGLTGTREPAPPALPGPPSPTSRPTSTPQPARTTTATPTPTAATTTAPTALHPPALTDLLVSPSGVGPLHLGDPVPVTPAPSDLLTWVPDYCTNMDDPGAWRGVYPDALNPNGAPFAPLSAWVLDDHVATITVATPGPRTAGGIQVGSTLDALLAAHPDARTVPLEGLDAMTVLAVPGSTGVLVFEVSLEQPTDVVMLIRVVPTGDPITAEWGTDGPCA